MAGIIMPYRFGPAFGGPGEMIAEPHLHWRMRTFRAANLGDYPSIATFGLRTVASGSDVLQGAGTLTYSSQFDSGGNAAANAFDGDLATQWSPSTRVGDHWLAKEMGAPIRPVEWVIGFRSAGTTNSSPYAQYLNYSDDGIAWHVRACVDDKVYALSEVNVHDLAADPGDAYTHWRALFLDPLDGGSSVNFNEIEMAATVGGADLCTPSNGTASDVNSFDNNTATGTTIGSLTFLAATFVFNSPRQIKELRWHAGGVANAPQTVALQFRHPTDTRLWLTASSAVGVSYSGAEWKSAVNAYVL